MKEKPRILVTGATGFIGRRLVKNLLDEDYPVRCLSRRPDGRLPQGVEAARGDLLSPSSLAGALKGIDTAYYLVHSLDAGESRFADRDRRAADNFAAAAEKNGVRRVIYLSGLGEENLSEHLESRGEVADILGRGKFETTVLRAAIIIGAGGASTEILRFIVKTQPVIPAPPSLETRCQPIAVKDAIGYLIGCLVEERTAGETFDIGGPEVLSYKEMLEGFARAAGTVNLYVPLPSSFFSPCLASSIIGLISPTKTEVALALLKGLKNEVVCKDNRIRELIPLPLTLYEEAVRIALRQRREEPPSA